MTDKPEKPKPSSLKGTLKKPQPQGSVKPASASVTSKGTVKQPAAKPTARITSSKLNTSYSPPSAPGGLSEEISTELTALDYRLSTLQSAVGFDEHRVAAGDLDDGLGALAEMIDRCRARGYCYQSYLERKVETLASKWQAARPRLLREIDEAERELEPLLNSSFTARNGITTAAARTQLPAFKRNLDALDTRVKSAQTAIETIYGGIHETYNQTLAQVKGIQTMMDALDQASFALLAGEGAVQAVAAKWWRDGKNEGPEGTLYLTDQRLLFEQNEEIATKKVLFIATEKETVRQLVFDAPLGSVQDTKSSAKGMFGNEDHLDFTFGSGAPYTQAHFHINGQESDDWVGLVKRVQTGDIQSERTADIPAAIQAGDAAAVNAPAKCTACSAPITTRIMHGQREITCEYCGNVMRW